MYWIQPSGGAFYIEDRCWACGKVVISTFNQAIHLPDHPVLHYYIIDQTSM